MLNDHYLLKFREGAGNWVCDGYSVDVRYIALIVGEEVCISSASVTLGPLPFQKPYLFQVNAAEMRAGQCQLNGLTRDSVLQILELALKGSIMVLGTQMSLARAWDVPRLTGIQQLQSWARRPSRLET